VNLDGQLQQIIDELLSHGISLDLAKKEFDWVLAAKARPGHEKEDAKSKKDAQDARQKLK